MTTITRWTALVLAFLGIADAAYLAQSEISGALPSCTINGFDGCRIVAESSYAHLFGIPLGVYGLVFYGVVFALAAVSLLVAHDRITHALRVLSALGLVASVVFIGIQLLVIGALCLYCEASAVLAIGIFVAVWWGCSKKTTPRAKK